MKISVIIPAYNTEATITATINSVLSQTVAPYEILVFDDGSTDKTALFLESYKPHVTVFRQSNQGVAHARNYLCEQATGDIIAFVDADDIWHTNYLEVQRSLFKKYPNAVAYFTGHVTFHGHDNYQWDYRPLDVNFTDDLLNSLDFFKLYNESPGLFYPSFCCVPKLVLTELGSEPFNVSLKTAEDCHFFNSIAPLGPIVYTPLPLVAYRITEGALSANLLNLYCSVILAFELLEDRYKKLQDVNYWKAFKMYFASNRRYYARILMGAGQTLEARRQCSCSIRNSSNPVSIAKSLALLLMTYMPACLQPRWYSSFRQWPYESRPFSG